MTTDPMRDREEVQRAHDTLATLILEPSLYARLDGPTRSLLVTNLEVLCWILHHDHNRKFEELLEIIESHLEALGIVMLRHPEMQYPDQRRDRQ